MHRRRGVSGDIRHLGIYCFALTISVRRDIYQSTLLNIFIPTLIFNYPLLHVLAYLAGNILVNYYMKALGINGGHIPANLP